MGNLFSKLLDKYPVTPYLDSRDSFIKWMYFIHNQINLSLNIPEKTLQDTLQEYYKLYDSKEVQLKNKFIQREKYIYINIVTSLIILSIIFYKKS